MIKILAIETSTDACSVALLQDKSITEKYQVAPQKHTQLLIPMIDSLLQDAHLELKQLDAIAFGRGPGSFTGVRLAASIAQGLAFGAGLPIVVISPLRALAQQVYFQKQATKVMVAQDARMQEIYYGSYVLNQQQIMQENFPDTLLRPETLPMPAEITDWWRAGNAWTVYADTITKGYDRIPLANIIYPRAQEVALLASWDFLQGLAVKPEDALPIYLRNEVAKKKS
jgi:tRNA threonylcarbamoyladenosine biosynthesis protein TsaB